MRVRRSRERARRQRQRALSMVVAGWLLAGLAGTAVVKLWPSPGDASGPDSARAGDPLRQESWLLIGIDERFPRGAASWLAVLSYDRKTREGLFLYVPRTTNVEVPGFGLEIVAKARAYSGERLQVSTVSNLLGIGFDHFLRVSDQGWRALIDHAGGVTVDVPAEVIRETRDGRIKTIFEVGVQHLSGRRATEYLWSQDETADELARAVRHTTVWQAFLDKVRKGGTTKLLNTAGELFVTDAKGRDVANFFSKLAGSADDLVFETLPVTSVGVGAGTQFYSPDRKAIDKMVRRYLAGSRPDSLGRGGRRLEVLNGNGRPGIGERVATQVVPKGFRIILNQNAKSFEYRQTQIVLYSESEEALAVAEELQRILGVGEVLISRQRQSLVDVTLVIGKDYLRLHGID